MDATTAMRSQRSRSCTAPRGYSRDHRPDLKQVMLELSVEPQAGLPRLRPPLSGHRRAVPALGQVIRPPIEPWHTTDGVTYIVADRARSREANLQTLAQTAMQWSTRVPTTLSEAHAALAPVDPQALASLQAGDRDHELTSTDGGMAPRWVLSDAEPRQLPAQRPIDRPQRHPREAAVNALKTWDKQIERQTPYVGRGRGSASRQQRVLKKIRDHITRLARRGDNSAALTPRFGWQALVTNAVHKRLSLQEAVWCYRNEYRIERICNRLKSCVPIAPLFVTLNDHISGLTYLLTLGVRVLTVMECVLRRSLRKDQAKLPGLHPENQIKMTDTPTAERILKAFSDVLLTLRKHATGEEILRRLTPLSGLQKDILQRLGLGTSLYRQLEIQDIGN